MIKPPAADRAAFWRPFLLDAVVAADFNRRFRLVQKEPPQRHDHADRAVDLVLRLFLVRPD